VLRPDALAPNAQTHRQHVSGQPQRLITLKANPRPDWQRIIGPPRPRPALQRPKAHSTPKRLNSPSHCARSNSRSPKERVLFWRHGLSTLLRRSCIPILQPDRAHVRMLRDMQRCPHGPNLSRENDYQAKSLNPLTARASVVTSSLRTKRRMIVSTIPDTPIICLRDYYSASPARSSAAALARAGIVGGQTPAPRQCTKAQMASWLPFAEPSPRP